MFLYFDKVIYFIGAACLMLACQAQAASDDFERAHFSYNLGIDAWRLDPSVATDPAPWNAQNTNLLLPNAVNAWHFTNTSPYVIVSANQYIGKSTTLSFKAKANQISGLQLDEAALHKEISPSLGVRAGLVNYKTSWCRSYEPDNGWIREVETTCLTRTLSDVTGAAPGLQMVTQTFWDHFLVQSQVGIYRPMAFHYAPNEFGNFTPYTDFEVNNNHKYGFNLNLVDIDKAIEARLSYVHANQIAIITNTELSANIPQKSDLWYWGVSAPLTSKLSARLTRLTQNQNIQFWPTKDSGELRNIEFRQKKTSTSLELSYRATSIDLVSLGVSRTTFDDAGTYFSNINEVLAQDPPFYIRTKQFSIAWRHDWSSGLFAIVQGLWALENNAVNNGQYAAHGNAIGVRLGYQH
jgi:hypothetical protein